MLQDLSTTSNLFLNLLFVSLVDMIQLIGGITIIGLCLGMLEGVTNRYLMKAFGMKGVFITAWIGTPVHELSHAIMCFIFHHRVNKIKLLQIRSMDGILGYVEHHYNPGSLYQRIGNFFIGIAPILGGSFAIFLCMYFAVPDSYHTIFQYLNTEGKGDSVHHLFAITLPSIWILGKSLFSIQHIFQPLFWLFLFLSICISSNMALSKADMKGATSGITAFYILLFILNGVARFLQISPGQISMIISKVNIYVFSMLGFSLIFSLIALLLSYLLYLVKGFRSNGRKNA